MSLTDGSVTTLEGIQLQLAANLLGPNVQISGIDASSINNITLQAWHLPWFSVPPCRLSGSQRAVFIVSVCCFSDRSKRLAANIPAEQLACSAADRGARPGPAERRCSGSRRYGPSQRRHPARLRPVLTAHGDICQPDRRPSV